MSSIFFPSTPWDILDLVPTSYVHSSLDSVQFRGPQKSFVHLPSSGICCLSPKPNSDDRTPPHPHLSPVRVRHPTLLQAADKYPIKTIQDHYSLSQPKFLENEPLRVYATSIASRYRARDTAALVARCTLRYPLDAEYFYKLEIADGETVYRVLWYPKQCKVARPWISVTRAYTRY